MYVVMIVGNRKVTQNSDAQDTQLIGISKNDVGAKSHNQFVTKKMDRQTTGKQVTWKDEKNKIVRSASTAHS